MRQLDSARSLEPDPWDPRRRDIMLSLDPVPTTLVPRARTLRAVALQPYDNIQQLSPTIGLE